LFLTFLSLFLNLPPQRYVFSFGTKNSNMNSTSTPH
jgi:aminopeptidase C